MAKSINEISVSFSNRLSFVESLFVPEVKGVEVFLLLAEKVIQQTDLLPKS
ncbi:MAG: hypothetical protein ACI8P9_001888 [Parasphingorhabdus sp.]|jgi:hypothetical protein